MPRQIISRGAVQARALEVNQAPQEDAYLSKLVKLLPADVISVYMLLFNMVKSRGSDPGNPYLQWGLFILLLILTPIYLKRVANITSWKQIIVCEISFILWVFYMGGPVEGLTFGKETSQFYASLLVPVYTLMIPAFYK